PLYCDRVMSHLVKCTGQEPVSFPTRVSLLTDELALDDAHARGAGTEPPMFQRIRIPRTFALALRGLRHALYRVVGVAGGRPLLSMHEAMSDRELVGQHYAGTQPIALDRIVGSLDRSTDFDRGFGTRTTAQKSRVRDLGRAFRR